MRFLKITKLMILMVSITANQACRSSGNIFQVPGIIARHDWHAQEPDFNSRGEHGVYDSTTNKDGWRIYERPLREVLKTIVVHHSALPTNLGVAEIQKLHMQERGYADIGYHFVIDPDGVIFEGRNISVRGAHTSGHNTGSIGVVLLGNFEESAPNDRQYNSLRNLIHQLALKYKITRLAGHRDFHPDKTVCPGAELERKLPSLAAEFGMIFGTENGAP